ncbi:hypothetical protein [Halobacterium yunchengense]|uniref:hypothetical protein n=1 Tax=Halobacterium yunchengense TaxID=3108497 RepID=UPI003009934B
MERRQFLASASAAVPLALAGCLGGQDDDPSTTTEPDDTTGEPTTRPTTEQPTEDGPLSVGETASLSGDRALGVEGVDASAFVLTRGSGADAVHAVEGERYVRVTFAPDGVDDYESFVAEHCTLTVDDETFDDPVFPIGGGQVQFEAAYSVPADLTPYTASVDVDTGDAAATWAFDARDVEAVTQSVDYEVGDLSAPDSVPAGESFTAELPVDNGGDEIEFHAAVRGTANAPLRVSETLPGGEETTVEVDATAPERSGDDDQTGVEVGFEVAVDFGHGERSATVDYE